MIILLMSLGKKQTTCFAYLNQKLCFLNVKSALHKSLYVSTEQVEISPTQQRVVRGQRSDHATSERQQVASLLARTSAAPILQVCFLEQHQKQ